MFIIAISWANGTSLRNLCTSFLVIPTKVMSNERLNKEAKSFSDPPCYTYEPRKSCISILHYLGECENRDEFCVRGADSTHFRKLRKPTFWIPWKICCFELVVNYSAWKRRSSFGPKAENRSQKKQPMGCTNSSSKPTLSCYAIHVVNEPVYNRWIFF